MPPAWFEAWSAAVLASDPVGSRQNPPVYRSPAGPLQEVRDYWQKGLPLYDPGKIEARTLIVVAEWDAVNPEQGALALFHRLPGGPSKRFVELGEGTHLIILERNRMQLFREVQLFLEEAGPG